MTYDDCIKIINSKLKFGMKPGLERINKVLNQLGNPQDKLKFVHVAGTNGKGSTCNMIASVLKESGLKVGLFTSPFVLDFRDRFKINDVMISKEELCSLVEKIEPFSEVLTEFEFITVIAFEWFKDQECDIVVLETGLGGRFDATNVIKTTQVSVITSISLDHTLILGDNLEKIAMEKCGIIKPNGITVSYPDQNILAEKVIKKEAKNKNNTLVIPDFSKVEMIEYCMNGSTFKYEGNFINLNLLGKHQIKNCILAISALKALSQKGFYVSNLSITRGINKVNMTARIEVISRDPFIILDGSHNPDGSKALSNFLKEFFKNKNLIGIVGILKDKDYHSMIATLIPLLKKVYTVSVNSPRSLAASDLKKEVEKFCCYTYAKESIEDAVYCAMNTATSRDVIVIFGSLYLAKDFKEIFHR